VTRAIMRSLLVAVVVGVAVMGGYLLAFEVCTDRASPSRGVLQEGGFVRARATDRIWTCVTRHCFGDVAGVLCHDDESCFCAPAAWTEGEVSTRLRAVACRVDDGKACKNERCRAHAEE
jgi:hypothetical protein